ncbi:MAG: preprotein translocase subunit YajC [Elusimicrobiota bacterium]|nr:preprotein translocase subunit YajC [Elusimicrobiota bacterium]
MPPAPNPFINLAPIVAIFVIFYFLLIRPQQKQQKEHELMLKNLKSGDKVLTTGGLYGTITGFKGDDLEVQFSQTVKLTVARSAVASVVSDVKTGVVVR